MDNKTIFTKTAKGLGEALGKTKALSRDLRDIIKEIDGNASVEALQGKLGNVSKARLRDALTTLINGDYIRAFASPTVTADVDLDFGPNPSAVDALTEVTMGAFLRELSSAADNDKPDLNSTERPDETDAAEQNARIEDILREEQAVRAREDAKRKAKAVAEAQATKNAEEKSWLEAEVRAKKEAEEQAREKAAEQARQEAEEKSRCETEAQAKKEAEEKARRKAAVAQIRRDALEKYKRDNEERARKKAEDKARLEAEEQARLETEEQARRDVIENARREIEEQAQQAADERACLKEKERTRQEAERQARWEAEEEVRVAAEAQAKKQAERDAREKLKTEAEERARRRAQEKQERARREAARQAEWDATRRVGREAKEQARLAAQALALREAEERAKQEKDAAGSQLAEATEAQTKEQLETTEEAQARLQAEREDAQEAAYQAEQAAIFSKPAKPYRKPVKWRKYAALILFFLAAAGVVWIQVTSFDDQARAFEKTAAEQFRQPVKIGKVHLALMPQPHWRLEGVSIGKDAQIKVARIDAIAELDTLFSDKVVFKTVELTSPILKEEALGWLLFGKPQGRDFRNLAVSASNARLDTQSIVLPAFDARTEIGADGIWQKISLEDASRKTRIELQSKGESVQIELNANALAALIGSTVPLEKINAKGTVSRDEIMFTEFDGIIHNGVIKGSARLKWGASWSLAGDVSARRLSMATWAPQLLEGGKLEGSAKYALQAQTASLLFSAPRLKGNFEIRNGAVLGVELISLLRGFSLGGKSSFSEGSGAFVYESGRIQLRNVNLRAGLISANGNLDVDANDKLNGRFTIDLAASTRHARANLAVSGTLKEPRFAP